MLPNSNLLLVASPHNQQVWKSPPYQISQGHPKPATSVQAPTLQNTGKQEEICFHLSARAHIASAPQRV